MKIISYIKWSCLFTKKIHIMIVKQGKRLVVHPPSGSLHCVFNTQFMCLKCDILSYLVMLLPHIVGFYVTWGIIMQPADLSSSGS